MSDEGHYEKQGVCVPTFGQVTWWHKKARGVSKEVLYLHEMIVAALGFKQGPEEAYRWKGKMFYVSINIDVTPLTPEEEQKWREHAYDGD